MLPLQRRHSLDNRAQSIIPPPAGDDLSAVLATMVRSWRDDFDQATLNAARWNILAEPGQSQSSALGPVLEFPDHWGTYTHDPALVTLSGGVLRLGWAVTGGAWRAGGITSASSYGAAASAKASSIFGVTRASVRVPSTAGNSFGAVWQMPVANAHGAWPNSGEIDILEWTQAIDPANADRHTAFSNVILAGGANSRTSGALVSPAFDLLDGAYHDIACWRRATSNGVAIDFFIDNRRYGQVEITGSAADPLREAFYYLLTAQLGWWGTGLPPDSSLAAQYFEIDYIEQWSEVTTPPSSKPTAAAVLDAKGYLSAWQDRLGETDAPTDDRQFFGAYTGARVSEDPPDGYPAENNRRLSFITFDGKPCLKSIYRAGEHGWLNFRSMVLPQRYRKIGLAVDVFVPTAFELLNSSGATISGKTMFGLVIGHPDHQRPGVLPGWAPNVPSRAWRGAVCVPEDQLGAECGINWTYRNTTGAFEFDIYAHVPGRRSAGVYYPRMDAFSNIYAISGVAASPKVPVPRGRWFTLTWLAEIDTNAGDGVLEMWYDNVLVASVTGIDLGGWVGDRGLYKGRTKTAAPSGMADTDTNRQQYSFGFGDLSNTALGQYAWNKGGWRGQGIFIRDMIGGVTADPAKVPRTTSAYYTYNWRVKGVV